MTTEITENGTEATSLGAQSAAGAPEETTPNNIATRRKGASKARKSAKAAETKKISEKAPKSSKTAKPRSEGVREGSKTAKILNLMRRAKGATLAEIMEASSWQPHSVRGFISGTLGKKMGLTVQSAKRADGTRFYSLEK
jgi:hypothetical protein